MPEFVTEFSVEHWKREPIFETCRVIVRNKFYNNLVEPDKEIFFTIDCYDYYFEEFNQYNLSTKSNWWEMVKKYRGR